MKIGISTSGQTMAGTPTAMAMATDRRHAAARMTREATTWLRAAIEAGRMGLAYASDDCLARADEIGADCDALVGIDGN